MFMPLCILPRLCVCGNIKPSCYLIPVGKMSIDIFEVIESSVPSDYYRTLHYVYGIVILFALYFKTCIM